MYIDRQILEDILKKRFNLYCELQHIYHDIEMERYYYEGCARAVSQIAGQFGIKLGDKQ